MGSIYAFVFNLYGSLVRVGILSNLIKGPSNGITVDEDGISYSKLGSFARFHLRKLLVFSELG